MKGAAETGITVFVDSVPRTLPFGATLCEAARQFSPFGTEPVIVLLNGLRHEADDPAPLHDGDTLAFYPLLIGG